MSSHAVYELLCDTVPLMVETRTFRGVTFRRYPDAPGWSERAYFTPAQHARERGVGRLHEEVWKAAHGPIPPGHDIHHANFDHDDNRLVNLVCLPSGRHQALHVEHRRTNGLFPTPTPYARAKAAEWHRSPEGLEWHRQHAENIGLGRGEERELACEQCGEAFTTNASHNQARFCSNRCKTAWRVAAGIDDIDYTCGWCDVEFRASRYAKRKYCTKSCAAKAARARRKVS